MADWILFAAMPNVSFQKSIETDYLAIVGEKDARYKAIASGIRPSAAILTRFKDAFGSEKSSSAFLVRKDTPKHLLNTQALVAFRNAAVLPELFSGWAQALMSTSGGSWRPIWSDYFDLYPWKASKDDDGFINVNLSGLSWHTDIASFSPQTSALISPVEVYDLHDNRLREALLRLWRFHYEKRHRNFKSTQIFRSLEVAYSAARIPNANEASSQDVGIALSLWVSAFEIISCHKKSNALTVLEMLGKASWESDNLSSKAYTVLVSKQVNLAQALYMQLNSLRNDYIHGNRIKTDKLYCLEKRSRAALFHIAPLLYRVALAAAVGRPERKIPQNWGKGTGVERDLRRLLISSKLNKHLTHEVGWPFEEAIVAAALGKQRKRKP